MIAGAGDVPPGGPQQDDRSIGFERIARLVYSDQTMQSVLDLVVELVKRSVPGVDGAGVTLRADGGWDTAARSDLFVIELDRLQYEENDGPCIDTVRDGTPNLCPDLRIEERWPGFSRRAVESGALSVLSMPLIRTEVAIGALNLYSRTAGAFDEASIELAATFALHASVSVSGSQAFAESEEINTQLREALESRQLIGEAKGILMERDGLNSAGAFDALRELSQRQNRKLRDVAAEIVERADEAGSAP